MLDFDHARQTMVTRQVAARGVNDERVLAAMRRVPRERFVPGELRELAYDDTALPLTDGQTISQPYIVAVMAEAAEIEPDDRVLEIGAGSGYAAAVLAEMAREVVTIERKPSLARRARRNLSEAGYREVKVITGDGTLGWPEAAPFDAILAAAGGSHIPPAWKDQLAVGGRLVMPVGETSRRQSLRKILRTGLDRFEEEDLGQVVFVPLVGAEGWLEDESAPAGRPRSSEPRAFDGR